MQDNYFDEIVRTKLESLETPYVPSDWDAFAAQLDVPFDEAIRAKLHEAEVPFVPADWAAMSSALMEPFDRSIAEKLNSPELAAIAPPGGDWAAMAGTLDDAFDAEMADKLGNHQVPYMVEDWGAMTSELNAVFPSSNPSNKGILWISVFFLFLLFSWHRNQEHVRFNASRALSMEASPATVDPPKEAETPLISSSEKDVPQAIKIEKDEALPLAEAKENQHPAQTHLPIDLDKGKESKFLVEKSLSLGSGGVSRSASSQVALPARASVKKKTFLEIARLASPIDKYGRRIGLAEVASPILHLATDNDSKEALAMGDFRIGFYAASFSNVTELNEAGKRGYASGIRVELPLTSSWSIVSGLLLANKQFDRMIFEPSVNDPQNTAARQASFFVSRLKANFQLIELPMLAKYRFQAKGPVSFYLQAGLAPYIALEEEYFDFNPRSASNINQTNSIPLDLTQPIVNTELQANLTQIENYFYTETELDPTYQHQRAKTYLGTFQFAPGIEVSLGKKVDLQVEPYFQLGLQRMGTRSQKLHAAGGAFSLIYTFKK